MNILITGVHGFVGSNLVATLKANHTIFGLDIVSPHKEGLLNTFGWNELECIPSVDIIIHLAGKAHDTKNHTNAKIYYEINTKLTQKIYDWFLASASTKFIFFSSVKAAADRVESEMLTEDVVPAPKGPYGESKIAAEQYILQHLAIEKMVYILRPCVIHGPGNKGNLDLLFNFVKKGIPYPLGAFKNRRSFTSIDNMCFVISKLIEKNVPSGIYNMSDDESLSTNELITIIAKALAKPVRIWKWNPSVMHLFAQIGTVLHLPLNAKRFQRLTENFVVSNEKIKKALGIKKMPVSATEGFLKTLQSYEK